MTETSKRWAAPNKHIGKRAGNRLRLNGNR